MSTRTKVIVFLIGTVLFVMLNHESYHLFFESLPLRRDLISGTPEADQWIVHRMWRLFRQTASIWDVAAGVGCVAIAALVLRINRPFSRVGWISFTWPVLVMPLFAWAFVVHPWLMVGLVISAGVFPLIATIQVIRKKGSYSDLLSIPFYLAYFLLLYSWFGAMFRLYYPS